MIVTDVLGLFAPPDLAELTDAVSRLFSVEMLLQPPAEHALRPCSRVDGGFAAIMVDITERKQMESQPRYRALHDHGLANRVLCLDRIALAGERAQRRPGMRYAVVFMDLDRFKIINYSLGHEAGASCCCARRPAVSLHPPHGHRVPLRRRRIRHRAGGAFRSGGAAHVLRRIREASSRPVHRRAQHPGGGQPASPIPGRTIGARTFCATPTSPCTAPSTPAATAWCVHKQSNAAAIEARSMENDDPAGSIDGEFHMLYQVLKLPETFNF